jgi:23S rRNA U2552 (ribose-2'-O)-methylase RlmE/FtsJ
VDDLFFRRKMRKLTKIFVISVVLLLPVLVFLFLKQFGSNEFVLPVYYEEGHPFEECYSDAQAHHVSAEFAKTYLRSKTSLVTFEGASVNDYLYDLQNVLKKYPEVKVIKINFCCISEESKQKILNCELVLGEDRFIDKLIMNKYVLIDSARQIRGYFEVDDLDEINRLDMELDILLNY